MSRPMQDVDTSRELSQQQLAELFGTRLKDHPLVRSHLDEDLLDRLENHGNQNIASLFWHEQDWLLNPHRRSWLSEAEANRVVETMERISWLFVPHDPLELLINIAAASGYTSTRNGEFDKEKAYTPDFSC